MNMSDLSIGIKNNLLDKDNKLNTWASRDKWVTRNSLNWLINAINAAIPGYSLPLQIDFILRFNGNIPNCNACGASFKILSKKETYLCRKCTVEYGNKQRKHTLFSLYNVDNISKVPSVISKRKETTLKRYGVENVMKSKVIQNRCEETMRSRYGVVNPMQNKDIREKTAATNLNRYGNACAMNSIEAINNRKIHMMQEYGVSHHMQIEAVKDKLKETVQERYGTDNVFQNSLIKDEIKKTNLQRFGVDHPMKSSEIRDKVKSTNLERYGFEYAIQSPIIQAKIKQTTLNRWGVEYAQQNKDISDRRIKEAKRKYREKLLCTFTSEQLQLIANPSVIYDDHIKNKLNVYALSDKYKFTKSFLWDLFAKHDYEWVYYRNVSQGQRDLGNYIHDS